MSQEIIRQVAWKQNVPKFWVEPNALTGDGGTIGSWNHYSTQVLAYYDAS